MRRWLVLLAVLCLIYPTKTYGALPEEVTRELPSEAQELLRTLDENTPVQSLWQAGLSALREKASAGAGRILRQSLGGGAAVLGAVLLCAMAEAILQPESGTGAPNYVSLSGVLAITAAAAGQLHGMMQLGTETVAQLDILAKTLLPTLAAASAAAGGMAAAGARQVATVFFANLLLSLIHGVLLPLVYFYIAAAAAHAMLPGRRLKAIADGIRRGVTLTLTTSLGLFTAYLSISGAAAGAADQMAVQMTRSAIATAVPVVGGIISDAAGSVLAGAALLRSTIGILGLLGVLAVCLTPFLALGIRYLVYRGAAFLAGIAGGGLAAYVEALGSAFGLILGMTGSCALLLLISITSSIKAVAIWQ